MIKSNVAIIGGGVSGLSVAYNLARSPDFDGKITVFEKSGTLGGNADTAEVLLGYDYRQDTPFTRLADLGVNDINLSSYTRTKAAMIDIGYFPKNGDAALDHEDRNLRVLEDTVCYFTPDGSEIWTMDGFLMGRDERSDDTGTLRDRYVVDMRFSINRPEHKALRDAEDLFMTTAAEDFKPQNSGKPYWNYTTGAYLDYFAQKDLIAPELLKQVKEWFLLPRISAMYFADEQRGAMAMPFRGVMSYYRLQEGFGTESKPDRRYFTFGSQHWINALARYLQTELGVKIVRNFEANVMADGKDGVLVYSQGEAEQTKGLPAAQTFDKVVMAGHADHQLRSFVPGAQPLLTREMARMLSSIRYSSSISIAHTYTAILPPSIGSWRTYNVMIRDTGNVQPAPYQMTYVQNRHRNDHQNPTFNAYGMPVYFVTLNPEVRIPDKYILDVTTQDTHRRMIEQPGYAHTLSPDAQRADKAIATLRHTVMTHELLEVQAKLADQQGMAGGRVYFAGCWAIGAGLHEECFMQSERVVSAITAPREAV